MRRVLERFTLSARRNAAMNKYRPVRVVRAFRLGHFAGSNSGMAFTWQGSVYISLRIEALSVTCVVIIIAGSLLRTCRKFRCGRKRERCSPMRRASGDRIETGDEVD